MRRRRFYSLPAVTIAVALLIAPNTERADCGNAKDRHAAAVAKVIEALRGYQACIAAAAKDGARRGDCGAEMQAVDDAHDDFVDAVDDAKDCR